MNQKNLLEVDWSKIPAPTDDGAAAHLVGMTIPPLSLIATDDNSVTLSALPGRTVVFAYPRTGEPGKISLVDDWDMIPGARGCTPQTCSFRDLFAELKAAGARHVFGLSTQSNVYQTEMASRLHLPFPVLSDEKLALTRALKLPTMEVAGLTLIKRLALIIDDGRITPRVLSGVSAGPERRRRAGVAEGKSGLAFGQIRAHGRKHIAKHFRRQHPRIRVVARAVIAVVEPDRRRPHARRRARRGGGIAKTKGLQGRFMGDPPERHDRAKPGHGGDRRDQELPAGVDLGRQRLVLRRHAAHRVADPAIDELATRRQAAPDRCPWQSHIRARWHRAGRRRSRR